jgi:hypothetical protein
MRRIVAVPAAVLVAVVAAFFAYTTFADRSTPAGQPPLAEVNQQSLETFKSDFNRARGQVRVIALLSPT